MPSPEGLRPSREEAKGTPQENLVEAREPVYQNSRLYFQQVKKNSHWRSVISMSLALDLAAMRVSSSGTNQVGTIVPFMLRRSERRSSDWRVSSLVSPGRPMMKVQKGNQLWRLRISMPLTTTSRHWWAL